MRCYNHHDKEAVGVCRFCGRGLCPGCATEVEKAVACRDRCEAEVATILSLNRNALQFARTTKQARYLAPTILIVLGGALTMLGLTYRGFDLAIIAGGVVVVVGVAFLVIQYRMGRGLKA